MVAKAIYASKLNIFNINSLSEVELTCITWVQTLVNIKGVVNCQNSQDKGPPEGNSVRG